MQYFGGSQPGTTELIHRKYSGSGRCAPVPRRTIWVLEVSSLRGCEI
jgi:hypothetical protein